MPTHECLSVCVCVCLQFIRAKNFARNANTNKIIRTCGVGWHSGWKEKRERVGRIQGEESRGTRSGQLQ